MSRPVDAAVCIKEDLVMKKIIGIVSAILAILLLSIAVFAADGTSSNQAPGGEVRDVEDFIAAFGGEKNVYLNKKSGYITFNNSVVLKSPVVIKEGSYKVIGCGVIISRGFDGDALIKLENEASLTIGRESDDAFDEKDPELVMNGNGKSGPFISLSGSAELTVNSGVYFKNASSSGYGGAIYASDKSSVTLMNCCFENCRSSLGGGAVAIESEKLGEEGALLTASGVLFTDNVSENDAKNAKGGAVYAYGGRFKITGCVLENNSADLGGVVWACSQGEISSCDEVQNNKANVSGGVLYVASDGDKVGSVTLSGGVFEYNSSEGSGGVVSNLGALIISGGAYIYENTAATDGGAVYNEGSLGITNGTILYNTCGYRGGGICNIGDLSVLAMSGGEITYNKGLFGAGVFCEGTFLMSGGGVGNNLSDEPGVVVYRDMTLSSSASIGDTIALCQNGEVNPKIKLEGELTVKSGFSVVCVKEKTDKSGRISRYVVKNSLGSSVITGDVEKNAGGFVISSSFLKYKVNSEGRLGMSFPFFPVWVWICVLCIILLAAGAVFYVKVGRRLIADKIAEIKNKGRE